MSRGYPGRATEQLAERARLQSKLNRELAAADAAGERLKSVESQTAIARPILRGAVDLADGVLALPRLIATAPVAGYNVLTGSNVPLPINQSVADVRSGARNVLTARNQDEATATMLAQGLGGVMGGLGIGGALGGTIGGALAANPSAQMAATIGSVAALEGAKRTGAGPKTQLAAMMLGGMIPGSGGKSPQGLKAVTESAIAQVDLSSAIAAVKRWLQAGKPRHEWASGGNFAKDASKAVNEVTTINEPGVFWRGTNRTDEIDDVLKGVQIRSKNHVDGATEAGMSVSDSPATIWSYGYPYGYKVKGTLIGRGSDGEPLLINAKPIGSSLTKDEILAADKSRLLELKRRAAEIAKETGIDESLIGWLASRAE